MDNPEAIKISLRSAQNVLFPLISGIGIIANGVVIIVITIWERYRANRTVANLFAVNLAVADLLFLVVLPLHMPALQGGALNNNAVCKLTEVTKYINFRASILFLTMMSVDRFLAIVYTLQTRAYRSRMASLKVCLVLWVVSIVAAVPAGIYAGIDTEGDLQCKLMFEGYDSGTISVDDFYKIDDFFNVSSYDYSGYSSGEDVMYTCGAGEHANSKFYQVWVYAGFVIFFLLPITTIVLSYACIIKATVSRQIQASTKKNQNRVTIMVAVLVIAFIASWMPQQVWVLMTMPPGTTVVYAALCGILNTTFALLAWSNSALNPILYSISSQRFRTKAIKCWKYVRFGYQRSMLMEQQSVRTLQTRLATVRQRPSSQPSSPTAIAQVQENVNPTFEQDTQIQTKL